LIAEYLSQHAIADAALAARFRAAADGRPADPKGLNAEPDPVDTPPSLAAPGDPPSVSSSPSVPCLVTATIDGGADSTDSKDFRDSTEEVDAEAFPELAPCIPRAWLDAAIAATEEDPIRREEQAREQMERETGSDDPRGWITGPVQGDDVREPNDPASDDAEVQETGFDRAAWVLDPDFVGKAPKTARRASVVDHLPSVIEAEAVQAMPTARDR
jgi:hypothetical protein